MPLILNQAQAEAVYSAMCALNNVGGKADAEFNDHAGTVTTVQDFGDTGIRVSRIDPKAQRVGEWYDTQSAFARAYNLATGA